MAGNISNLKDFPSYHTKKVKSIAISADGQTMVSGSADNTVKIWDFDQKL
ncbi:MAG: hypothetical protein F6K08_05125 [Okeania sp. SIO1H6]|nr:hypothetical protein [Okeania sp. SIO1H6]